MCIRDRYRSRLCIYILLKFEKCNLRKLLCLPEMQKSMFLWNYFEWRGSEWAYGVKNFFFKKHWLKPLKFDSGRLNQTENTEISVIWFRKTIPKFRYILVISALTVSVDHWPLRLLLVDTLFIALFTHFCLLCAILENISLVLQYSLQEINLAIKCLLSSWRLCLFNFSNWF